MSCKLQLEFVEKKSETVLSDPSWRMSTVAGEGWELPTFDASGWQGSLKSLGQLGVKPWGIPAGGPSDEAELSSDLQVPEGFEAELLYRVPASTQGS